jgi:membrane-bound ClpP family serine protease
MGLDIRWPIGLMFSLLGAMLVIFGLATNSNSEMYQHSLNINVNVRWGLLLVVFGATMLTLAWRGSRQAEPPPGADKPAKPE